MITIEALYDELRAYKRSRVLSLAIKYGFLEFLMQKPKTIEEIAQEKNLPSRIVIIFLNVLRNLDLVSCSRQHFALTELGHQAALDNTFCAFAGYHNYCFNAWTLLPEFCEAVDKSGMGYHQRQIKDTEFCEAYLKSMDAIASKQISNIENICKPFISGNFLDIGAGPSTFGRYLAEKKLCNVTAIDFPEIVVAAKKLFTMPSGFFWQGVDFRDFYPKQAFDIVYCGHFLEYFSEESLNKCLSHIKDVLVSNGKVIIVCFLRNEDADSLQLDLDLFELSTCLNGTSTGQIISGLQIKKLLKHNGYKDIKISALSTGPSYNESLITCTVMN